MALLGTTKLVKAMIDAYSDIISFMKFLLQGSTFRKKPWGQVAPKFSYFVASTSILLAKHFQFCGPHIFP